MNGAKRTKTLLLKTAIHLLAGGAMLYLLAQTLTGGLGGDPVQAIVHFSGDSSLHLLLLTLMVTPVSRLWRTSGIAQTRRLLGLYTFAWATIHVLAYLTFDIQWDIPLFLQEALTRPHLIVGLAAFLILLALAATSTQGMQRRLGKHWTRLHATIYLTALLVPLHYFLSVKSGMTFPLIYGGAAICLLALRWRRFLSWIRPKH